MSKARIIFVCSNCGANSPKWIGHCPSCGTWNSYQEEILENREESEPGWKTIKEDHKNLKSVRLDQLETGKLLRLDTHDKELNRALGGGLVRGSVTLLAGQPGIGKSTLLLQLALQIRLQAVLYVSGEESEEQIKKRSKL